MWPGCLGTHEYAPPRFSHFWGQWMKFTSLLQPFYATSIHSGVFVGSLDNVVVVVVFFFFCGEFFATLWQKIRYDSYKWFLWKKKWQSDHIFRAKKRRRNRHFFSDHIFRAKKRRRNRHFFRIVSNRFPKQKYTVFFFFWGWIFLPLCDKN